MKKFHFTMEQTKGRDFAHTYVLRNEQGESLGELWNGQGSGQARAQITASGDLVQAVKDIMPDVEILFRIHRDHGNRYLEALKKALKASELYG